MRRTWKQTIQECYLFLKHLHLNSKCIVLSQLFTIIDLFKKKKLIAYITIFIEDVSDFKRFTSKAFTMCTLKNFIENKTRPQLYGLR